jgi:hypothetical protein
MLSDGAGLPTSISSSSPSVKLLPKPRLPFAIAYSKPFKSHLAAACCHVATSPCPRLDFTLNLRTLPRGNIHRSANKISPYLTNPISQNMSLIIVF